MAVNQDNVLTIDALAAYLKISKSTLYKLAQKAGKHRRFRRDIIDQLMAENTSATRRKNEG